MISSRTYHGITFDWVAAAGERVCYILLPEGLKDDGRAWMETAAERFGVSVVAMSGMDWNDALTPWGAEGVFKKAKPFAGHAELFLKDLREDYFPSVEASLGLKRPERYLVGISLSGLFAVWSLFKCSLFAGVASISGSLWYNGFAEWVNNQTLAAPERRVFLSLGDREKKSKDKRMATVEDATRLVVDSLRAKGASVSFLLEPDTTHFSPLVPRLSLAFDGLFGDNFLSL